LVYLIVYALRMFRLEHLGKPEYRDFELTCRKYLLKSLPLNNYHVLDGSGKVTEEFKALIRTVMKLAVFADSL